MDLHHCPRCELRFRNTGELRQHFVTDHGGDAATFERFRYRAGPSTSSDVHTVLLVGNEALESDAVLDVAAARAGHGGRVVVVAPVGAGHAGAEAPVARWRLEAALDHLRAADCDAEGIVGDTDPFAAVTRAMGRQHVDEIGVSTLPDAASHWLGVDLPERLRRQTHRPVHVLPPVATG